MIEIVGTSHVSKQSIDRINEAFEKYDPDVVCLELDKNRLNSLLADEKDKSSMSLIHRGLAAFQNYIGKKTGMMPGEEMLYAYRKAREKDAQVYLIDQDIQVTLGRIGDVKRKEKAKVAAMLPLSLLTGGRFDYTQIPDQDAIDELTDVFKERFPELYQVFVTERDIHMAESLRIVKQRHPEASVVAVVGAAHKKGLEEMANEIDSQSTVEKEEKQTKLDC